MRWLKNITCIIKSQRMEQVRRVWSPYDPNADSEVSLISRQGWSEEKPQGTARVHPWDAALSTA